MLSASIVNTSQYGISESLFRKGIMRPCRIGDDAETEVQQNETEKKQKRIKAPIVIDEAPQADLGSSSETTRLSFKICLSFSIVACF